MDEVPGAPGTIPMCVTSAAGGCTVSDLSGEQGAHRVRRGSRMTPVLRAEAKCGNESQGRLALERLRLPDRKGKVSVQPPPAGSLW